MKFSRSFQEWAIYDKQTRSYQELLHLSGKKKIHAQNLQILMVEVNASAT